MSRYLTVVLLLAALALTRCSASPTDPVNNTYPIRQMDNFFRGLDSPPPPPSAVPDYEHEPGYAPAYPPYQP